MNSKPSAFRPLILALFVTLMQIFVAVVLIAPEGPLAIRYDTLVQHDSYWFANIVDRGYETTVPPINHKMMEVSNVAFFPGLSGDRGGAASRVCTSALYKALLITAQAAAWGFWSYFFLFCDRWNVSPVLQFFGALGDPGPSDGFFSGRRIFRVAFHDGAVRLHVLEQRRRPGREMCWRRCTAS